MQSNNPAITVVLQPIDETPGDQFLTFLDVLSEVAEVTVVSRTDQFPEYDYVSYGSENTTGNMASDGAGYLSNQFKMCSAIGKAGNDIVWFYGSDLYAIPIVYARLKKEIVVVQPKGNVPLALYHNQSGPRFVRNLVRIVLKSMRQIGFIASDQIVTYSPGMAREYDGITEAIDYGYRYVPERFASFEEYSNRAPVAGYLGRLDPDKNVDTVIEVAKKTECVFHIGGDGSEFHRVENELSGRSDVVVHGWIDTPEAFLNRLRFLVCPSYPIEGVPTAIMEAFACGTPVIATRVSGIPDLVKDRKTGFIVDDDPDEIAKVTDLAVRGDYSDMSKNCRNKRERMLTKDKAIDRYDRIVSEIVDRHR